MSTTFLIAYIVVIFEPVLVRSSLSPEGNTLVGCGACQAVKVKQYECDVQCNIIGKGKSFYPIGFNQSTWLGRPPDLEAGGSEMAGAKCTSDSNQEKIILKASAIKNAILVIAF